MGACEDAPDVEFAKALLKRAKVPARYAGRISPCHAYDKLFEDGDGLYIVGGTGTGKTHLAWCVVLGYLENHVRPNGTGYYFSKKVCLVTVSDLMDDIKGAFNDERSATEVLGRYSKYDLLVLDDLGKEVPTDWVRSKLFQIVNRRYNDRKATVVTSQYRPDQFVARMGARGRDDAVAIRSRLAEMCYLVEMEGRDRRSAISLESDDSAF